VTVRRGELGAGPAWLVLRPETLRVAPVAGEPDGALRGRVADLAFRGTAYAYRIEVPGLDDPLKVETAGGGAPLGVGEQVDVRWAADAARLLPRDGPT